MRRLQVSGLRLKTLSRIQLIPLVDDIPDPNSEDPADLAILASYANEQLLYHYIRWLVHRPGLALPHGDPQFASCLQIATEAASSMLRTLHTLIRATPLIKANPAVHPCTVFIAALTPLYRTTLLKSMPGTMPMLGYSAEDDLQACQDALGNLEYAAKDHSDTVRRRVLQQLITKVFGDDHEELKRLESIKSLPGQQSGTESTAGASSAREESSGGLHTQNSWNMMDQPLEYHEHRLDHLTTHEELRDFVHEAFSPNLDPWAPPGNDFQSGHGF